jgi:hypothetical protein
MTSLAVFLLGLATTLSPGLAYFQDTGWPWQRPDLEPGELDFINWFMSKRLDQIMLMRGMVLAGFLLMGASLAWGRA